MHLVQLEHPRKGQRVGIVEGNDIILLDETVTSTYELFTGIVNGEKSTPEAIRSFVSGDIINYDSVYNLSDQWHLLPPVNCPGEPLRCMLSGTGLTHKASAENRQKMHEHQSTDHLTDSMKMYMWGEEGGKPAPSTIGVQPEWFYKGNGHNLKGHGQPLTVPNYANDGGEEPEIAGIYLISAEGVPYRLGFAQANEFSDHVMEKKNYLYLAPSKIRNCSIGPELIITDAFDSLPGSVTIKRKGNVHWTRTIRSGESAMAHSLANLEYHHFKYAQHRLPGQLHIHFFGADAFSFGAHVQLQEGDEMHVSFENMGRPLINTLRIDSTKEQMQPIRSIKSQD